MNYESVNQYVLMVIGLFAVLLYCGLIYAGLSDFASRLSKDKKRFRSRSVARKLREAHRSEPFGSERTE